MPIEVLMPALSPTMKEGKILSWQQNEGSTVDASTVIAEIETDKAVMELEAPTKGNLAKILSNKAGETVKVGELIAVIAKKGETQEDVENFIKNFNTGDKDLKENKISNLEGEKEEIKTQINLTDFEKKETQPEIQDNQTERMKASPLAKKIAAQNNIDISKITQGSGPLGRVTKEDVENFLKNSLNESRGLYSANSNRNTQEFIEIPISSMRKAIASRLAQSKQEIPHFYISFEVEMDELLKTRESLNEILKIKEGEGSLKISINDMIMKAVAIAIERNPKINCSWQGDKILQYKNIDVCVAVALENGLVTPIIKNCNQKGLVAISREIKNLAKKAKEGTLKSNEFQGGGFTVSNLGTYSVVDSFSAIINPPQSSILSIAAVKDKVFVKNSKIEIKKTCQMQISADHRVLDGSDVAKFANDIKDIIENKIIMLLI